MENTGDDLKRELGRGELLIGAQYLMKTGD
jgi:hypothetical protein